MKISAWLRISSVTLCALALLACGASTTAPLSASALDAKKAGANKTTGSESAPSDSAAARRGSPDALVAFPTPIPVTEQDPSWGSPSAPVTIVEFTDLQCPFCGRGHATLKTIEEEYGPEKIRVILKHYPLPFHNKARPAAVVGAAIFQSFGRDAFWRYIDACFEKLGSQNLSEILADLNLDSERLRPIVESGESMTKVLSDMTLGERLGVNGTPAFFINGIMLSGAQPYSAFEEIVVRELANQD